MCCWKGGHSYTVNKLIYYDLIRMSAYTNVCLYECPLIQMSAYMNVRLYKCLLIQMSAYVNVRLYECPLIRMSTPLFNTEDYFPKLTNIATKLKCKL